MKYNAVWDCNVTVTVLEQSTLMTDLKKKTTKTLTKNELFEHLKFYIIYYQSQTYLIDILN